MAWRMGWINCARRRDVLRVTEFMNELLRGFFSPSARTDPHTMPMQRSASYHAHLPFAVLCRSAPQEADRRLVAATATAVARQRPLCAQTQATRHREAVANADAAPVAHAPDARGQGEPFARRSAHCVEHDRRRAWTKLERCRQCRFKSGAHAYFTRPRSAY